MSSNGLRATGIDRASSLQGRPGRSGLRAAVVVGVICCLGPWAQGAETALDVGFAVLRGDFSQARMLIERGASGKAAGLRRSLLILEKTNAAILSSFNAEQGQMVNIELTSGVEIVQVRHVEGDTIRVIRRVGTDEASDWTITVDQLAMSEKMRRLRVPPGPELNLMRGSIAWRGGDQAGALDYFRAAAGDPLAEALVDCLTQGGRQKAEAGARDDLQRLLKAAGLPQATVFDAKTARAIRRRAFGAAEAERVRAAAADFRKRHGSTDIGKSVAEVVAELERADVVTREVDVGMIDERLPQLREANPGAGELRFERRVTASGAEIIMAGNAAVTNVAALAGLPLMKANLSGCGIWDLSPFKGMPLRVLDVSGTAVRDLSPIAGAPIQELNLAGCAAIGDLSPLMTLPRLHTLVVPATALPEGLRQHPTLRLMGYAPGSLMPAGDFWSQRAAQGAPAVPPP